MHDIKKVNLFLHKLNPREEYKKNMNKITSYEDIVSENIHETGAADANTKTDVPVAIPMTRHLSNNMKIKDSIGIRKLQLKLNRSVKKPRPHPQSQLRQLDALSTTKLTRSRNNRTQRINVIKI